MLARAVEQIFFPIQIKPAAGDFPGFGHLGRGHLIRSEADGGFPGIRLWVVFLTIQPFDCVLVGSSSPAISEGMAHIFLAVFPAAHSGARNNPSPEFLHDASAGRKHAFRIKTQVPLDIWMIRLTSKWEGSSRENRTVTILVSLLSLAMTARASTCTLRLNHPLFAG